jgi:hypothetical protein
MTSIPPPPPPPPPQVYSKAGEVFDPTKKGGRWKPEFIWQTNWQEALKRQEDLERQQAEYRQRLADGSIDEEKAKGPGVLFGGGGKRGPEALCDGRGPCRGSRKHGEVP